MKPMIYGTERKIEILDEGTYLGFDYYILNLGTHPTAYVKLPKNVYIPMYDIRVHGGISYNENYLFLGQNKRIEGKFIGWDYSHCDDYTGYEKLFGKEPSNILGLSYKKWTTEEILEEVESVIEQIKKMREN